MNYNIIQSTAGQAKLSEIRKLWSYLILLPQSIADTKDKAAAIKSPGWLFAGKSPDSNVCKKLLIIISKAEGESITEAQGLADYAAKLGFHSIRLPASAFNLLQKQKQQWKSRVRSLLQKLDQSDPKHGWDSFFNDSKLVVGNVVMAQSTYPIPASIVVSKIQAQLAA